MAYYKCGRIYTTQNSNVVVDTSDGAIANFNTPLALPLIETRFGVKATQDLNGQSGPYPAGGGINKWDEENVNGYISSTDGRFISHVTSICSKNFNPVLPNTKYYPYKGSNVPTSYIYWYDSNKDYISRYPLAGQVVTTPNNTAYFKVSSYEYGATYNNDISINYPSTNTSYHPYSNICPINGVSEVSVYQLGGNFFNKNTVTSGYLINGSGNEVSYADWNLSDYIPVIEGASYYLYGLTNHPNTNQDNLELFDENKNKIGYANVKTNEQPYLIPSGVKYIKCCVKNQDLDTAQFGVFQNLSYCPYSPYIEKYIINLGGTYYGGYVEQDKDGHRRLVVTHKEFDLSTLEWSNSSLGASKWYAGANADLVINGKSLCPIYTSGNASVFINQNNIININVTGGGSSLIRVADTRFEGLTRAQIQASLSGIVAYCELASPITVDLPDGEPIKTLPGINNIYADTGDTSLQFIKLGN